MTSTPSPRVGTTPANPLPAARPLAPSSPTRAGGSSGSPLRAPGRAVPWWSLTRPVRALARLCWEVWEALMRPCPECEVWRG